MSILHDESTDRPRFDDATLANMEQLPCCPPMRPEDWKKCFGHPEGNPPPSVWIIESYMDGELIDKTPVCNNCVFSYMLDYPAGDNPFKAPCNQLYDKFVITKREDLN